MVTFGFVQHENGVRITEKSLYMKSRSLLALEYTDWVPIICSEVTSVSNYKLISLLPVVSKLLEKHIHSLISCHNYQDFLPIASHQWGFQPGKVCCLCLNWYAVTSAPSIHEFKNLISS